MEHLLLSIVLGFTITTLVWLVVRGRRLEREWDELKQWNEKLGGEWKTSHEDDPNNPMRVWIRDRQKILNALHETDTTLQKLREEKKERLHKESKIVSQDNDENHDDSPQW